MAKSKNKTVTINVSYSTLKLLGVLVLGLIIGYVAFGGNNSGSAGNQIVPGAGDPNQPAQRVDVSVDDDPAMGESDAPVTVIEFSDFECPFCQRAFTDAVAGIKKDYVATGKVRFVYRDYPLSFHAMATPAAEAAECAHEQGKFWEYHDQIFNNQANLTNANLKAWAAGLELDTAKFNSCVDTRKYKAEVEADFQAGSTAGVSGTPTFFIGNDKDGYIVIVGAQPYSALKQAIDAELA